MCIRCLVLLSAFVLGFMDAVQAQLPPQTLRFEPVIGGGRHWLIDLYQDPVGFLWAATEGGLIRYDGYTTRQYEANPGDPSSLSNNLVRAVSMGPGGRLWLALEGQLGYLNPASGAYETVSNEHVWDIAVDRSGEVWTVEAMADGRHWSLWLRTLAGTRQETAPFGEGEGFGGRFGRVPRLATDADGHVWIPGDAQGLARVSLLDNGAHAFSRWTPKTFAADTVFAVRAGGDGSVWAHTDRGYHRYRARDGSFALVLSTEELPVEARTIRDFLIDRRGLLWIAPRSLSGVYVADPATGDHVRFAHRTDDPTSLPDARVTKLYEDRGGVLWFGTTAGLYKAAPRWEAFHTYPLPASDLAATLAVDRRGGLWIGSLCAPLYAFDLADATFTAAAERLPGLDAPECPMRLLEDRGGCLWIGTFSLDGSNQGLVRYDPATETTTVYRSDPNDPAALGSRRIRDLLEDHRGQIWIGGEQGLDRYDPASDGFVHYGHDPNDATTLADPVVWSLAQTDDGMLWVGAGGLNRLDPETGLVTRFLPDPDDPTALPSGAITWIHPSRKEPGLLWLGTYDGGLVRFDIATSRVTRYTEADGLPDHYVKAVLEDERGRIWAPTQEGLARLDPATGEIRVFDEADGLHSRVFGLYDAVMLADGRFVLAHQDAIVVFHPDSVEAGLNEVLLALSAFRVFDREVPIAAVPEAPLRLRHDDDFFSFEFVALDFTAPERTHYAYRLDGFDDDWIESGTRRYAAYTNLPPGRYTFRVRADVGGGWGERELAVLLVIDPAWWQTWWFRFLAGLATLVALVAVVRMASTRKLRRDLRALEVDQKLQAERERISRDLHDHVGAQLSTIVSGIDLARLSAKGEADGGAGHLDRLEALARRTMTQLRETIWALHREAVTIESFYERVCAHAHERAALRADAPTIECTLEASEAETRRRLSPAQTLHLYRIAQEAIGNALEHAGAERLTVTVCVEMRGLVLEVRDDGRFETSEADGVDSDALRGYGLEGMRRRAEELGAAFTLDAEDGTTVRVVLPLSEALAGRPPGAGGLTAR
ncbi:MAG: hypothetical protein IH855_03450 [Bacteroidetes bacterium]|nr:hypothetical protein [Bacteroidota bacterium]